MCKKKKKKKKIMRILFKIKPFFRRVFYNQDFYTKINAAL